MSVIRRTGWLAHGVLYGLAAVTLAPLVWVVCASMKRNEDFFSSAFLPAGPDGGVDVTRLTGSHYWELFTVMGLGRALLNSVFLASVTSVVAALFCSMGGYALARHDFRGRRWVTALVLLAVIVPSPLLLAPGYQLLYQLGMLDTFAGLIVPAVAPAFGVFLFRQAVLTSAPMPLIEAARLDGCGEARVFFAVVAPLIRPMLGAFVLITFVGVWNNFLTPQVVLQTPSKFPLAVAVANLKNTYYQDYGLLMAGAVVSVAPVVGMFLVLQRDFLSGLTSGAVKG